MIISLRRWVEWGKFFLLFILLTLLFYQVITFFDLLLEPKPRYQEPGGRAVKVFARETVPRPSEEMGIKERLLLFYWLGE
jgi:hypothetical protein